MSDLLSAIRSIVREEMAGHRAAELAIVTQSFPGDGNSGNHQVNIRLRESGLEILRAPVAVARPGVALLPRTGDLVVVAFVGGDLNSPVVLGALYDSKIHPPQGGPLDAVYEPPDDSDDSVRRIFLRTPGGGEITLTDKALTVSLGGTEIVVNDGGDVTVTSQAKVSIEASSDITVKASGALTLEATSEVKIKGATVTIEGQGKAEVKAPAIAMSGMTQFKAS